jgi:hypothetical protein
LGPGRSVRCRTCYHLAPRTLTSRSPLHPHALPTAALLAVSSPGPTRRRMLAGQRARGESSTKRRREAETLTGANGAVGTGVCAQKRPRRRKKAFPRRLLATRGHPDSLGGASRCIALACASGRPLASALWTGIRGITSWRRTERRSPCRSTLPSRACRQSPARRRWASPRRRSYRAGICP